MPKGNLSAVMKAIAEHAEHSVNTRVANQGPLDAEVSERRRAEWYLVQTYPGDDIRALRLLARRRFGVFRPMQQREVNGKKVQGWEAVFPGWLFVFCWDIAKMERRIRSCPGVMDILCDPVSLRPVPVDHVADDGVSFVDRLRARHTNYATSAPTSHYEAKGERHVRRLKAAKPLPKPMRRQLAKLKDAVKEKKLWDDDTWERFNKLAAHDRITLLMRALDVARPLGTS